MRDNIKEVSQVAPDLMGFIFYPPSPRYVGDISEEELSCLPINIEKVGVFVNSELQEVLDKIKQYKLDYVQLHGEEDIAYCTHLKNTGIKVIKVFSGNKDLNEEELENYAEAIDFYLFDTRTNKYGGTGHQFDWNRLKNLKLKKPLFLSGGIDLESITRLGELNDLDVYAIDVNSKFEISPGLKNVDLIESLKSEMTKYADKTS